MYLILDRGHGVDTPGKRSKVWPNGKQLLEWEFNKRVIDKIEDWLSICDFVDYSVYPKRDEDVHVRDRKALYSRFASMSDDSVLVLSIHGDAFHRSTARGGTCYTSPGKTFSDRIAKNLKSSFQHYDLPVRSSKEAKYSVLMGAGYSAVLVELGFYTNFAECMFMLSDEGVEMYANVIIRGIVESLDKK